MKAVTIIRLAILLAVFSLILGAGYFAQGFQVERMARSVVKTAELAEKEGDFAKAERLYSEHLRVVLPEDVDVQIKYANALLKVDKSPRRQNEAIQIYSNVLRRADWREDARRRLMQLKIDRGFFNSTDPSDDGADLDLDILLKKSPDDGYLLFLRGRCYEAAEDYANAQAKYKEAVEHTWVMQEGDGSPDTSQRIEAYLRRALLLRDKLNQPKEADQAIEAMVQSAPENDQVYLARGRYRLAGAKGDLQKVLLAGARDDFEKARQLAPGKPETYLEMANTALQESGPDAAQRILEDGLKNAPKSIALYEALAKIEQNRGQLDKAIEILEDGVKRLSEHDLRLLSAAKEVGDIPTTGNDLIIVAAVDNVLHFRMFDSDGNKVVDTNEKRLTEQARQLEDLRKQLAGLWSRRELSGSDKDRVITAVTSVVGRTLASEPGPLRLMLADVLTRRGDMGKLRFQLEELNKIDYAPLEVKYYTAMYHLQKNNFLKARQNLLALRGRKELPPDFTARVNVLLAECYRHLGDSELEQDAIRRAHGANSENLAAKLLWIANLVKQGTIDEAIKEYQALVERAPEVRLSLTGLLRVRLSLAQLLIARNRRRPESQRDWSEVKRVIDDAAKAAPQSVDPVILEAELLSAQDKADEALNMLEKARSRFDKSVEIWIAQAKLLAVRGRVDEALKLLDQAKEQFGDPVELRLARAQLWAAKGGTQVVTVLNDLAQNVESFSSGDRRRLLEGLANELVRLQDLEGAARLWSRLADEDPNDLKLRLILLDLAFQIANQTEIEKNIKEIERMDGSEGLQSRFAQVRFLIWQADQTRDKKTQEELRTTARFRLTELRSRRAGLAGDSPSLGPARGTGAKARRPERR